MSRIWFEELDKDYWRRHAVTAPTQNGKTLMGYVLPILYYLFELNEVVIVGVPDMNMANDKWQRDILPIINASRYRDVLPIRGEGARGGRIKSGVIFRNGSQLRFMSGGASDKAAAGFPACRIVAITETDGMDESSEASREADKCRQIEARTRGREEEKVRIFLECTVSIEEGKIWQEYTLGTASRLVRPCPYCGEWVLPGREHLKGWQDAKDVEEAREKAAWHCPACDKPWTQKDREEGWKKLKLVHEGQEVDKATGDVVGPMPKTRTLGFRWTAIDNPFQTAARAGAEEWDGQRAKDRANAEKEICQWTNALPYKADSEDVIELEQETIEARQDALADGGEIIRYKRGEIPPWCIGIAVGVDTHSRILYWEAKAVLLRPDGVVNLHVCDHGTLQLDHTKLAREAIILGLTHLKRHFDGGWLGHDGQRWTPSQIWIDAGYAAHKKPIDIFCAAANKGLKVMECIWRPCKGHGESQATTTPYREPQIASAMQTKTNNVILVGNDYWIARPRHAKTKWTGVQLVHVNSDTWKTAFHQGWAIDPGEEGAITIFAEDGPEREKYQAQVCAEVQIEKMISDRGKVLVWRCVPPKAPNHYMDTGYLSTAAADFIVTYREKLTGGRPNTGGQPQSARRPSAKELQGRSSGRPVAIAMR